MLVLCLQDEDEVDERNGWNVHAVKSFLPCPYHRSTSLGILMLVLSAKEPFEILRCKIEEIFFVTVLRSIIILVYNKRKLHYSGNSHLDRFLHPNNEKKWRLNYNTLSIENIHIYFLFLLFFRKHWVKSISTYNILK